MKTICHPPKIGTPTAQVSQNLALVLQNKSFDPSIFIIRLDKPALASLLVN